jgi:hypothetical protein
VQVAASVPVDQLTRERTQATAARRDGRADLYSEICEVVLWRRQEAKGLEQPLTGVKKKAILADLAYTMMQRHVSDLRKTDVLAAIQPALRHVSASITPDDFLTQSASDGLLVEREPDQYAFAHKTFQEYLAAVHIREKGLVQVLADAVNDDWWTEVTLFYAAQSDAEPRHPGLPGRRHDSRSLPPGRYAGGATTKSMYDMSPNLGVFAVRAAALVPRRET